MRQKITSAHHRTTLSGCIFATKARIDNLEKNLLSSGLCPFWGELHLTQSRLDAGLPLRQYVLHMSSQYGELRPTNG